MGLLACVGAGALRAQGSPETTVAGVLASLSARADVAFAGEVLAVRPVGGVVEVQFRVDQTLKGVTSGAYVLREWAGMWAAGQRRYWVGERAVVFLHGPGAGGLGSSVDGMEGVLPLAQMAVAVDGAAGVAAVDVSRLRTVAQRGAGEPMVAAEPMPLTQVVEIARGGAATVGPPEKVPVHGGPVVAQPESPESHGGGLKRTPQRRESPQQVDAAPDEEPQPIRRVEVVLRVPDGSF